MVCKRSLYCWKNGPCASDQARKQIWEDNIRFRENLRSMNQSDHYWSFQVANNNTFCSCIDNQYVASRKPAQRKYLTGSLQKLDCFDCTSVTHDLKTKQERRRSHTEDALCPLHVGDGPTADRLNGGGYTIKGSLSACDLNNNRSMSSITRSINPKPVEDLPKFCPRYKNTLTSIPTKPCVKFKYSSQPSLLSDSKRNDLKKKNNTDIKSISPSLDNLRMADSSEQKESSEKTNNIDNPTKFISDMDRNLSILEKKKSRLPRRTGLVPLTKLVNRPVEVKKREKEVEDRDIDDSQPADVRKHKLLPRNVYTPLSRTTRKSLLQDKKMPFTTFGCNNGNSDVGTKRTHNVLASEEVYPSAMQARQRRNSMILKFLKNERELHKKLLPDNFKKKFINHSSVWASEYERKFKGTNSDSSTTNTIKKIPPISDKRVKSQSLFHQETKLPSKPAKVFRRSNSQAFFY